jgi:DNA-binding MarR family transcriptional regulator
MTTTFDAQLLGQTEKAANAILARLLAGPGLTEPQWVTLSLTMNTGGTLSRSELVERVVGALHIDDEQAQARVAELAAAELLEIPVDDRDQVRVTETGRRIYDGIRAETAQVTERLWGDLPADDLATTAHVLDTVLTRARVELSSEVSGLNRR